MYGQKGTKLEGQTKTWMDEKKAWMENRKDRSKKKRLKTLRDRWMDKQTGMQMGRWLGLGILIDKKNILILMINISLLDLFYFLDCPSLT